MRKATASYNLQIINPTLSKEWHQTKNGKLTPEDVMPSSGKKVWWLCKRGHEWEANIANRNRGNNCPYCSGQRAAKDNCLATINPSLAKEWHQTKNGKLTPEDVMPSSGKKVWWLCKRGHEWEADVDSRNRGNNCPYCSGHRAAKDNCLATMNPSLAKEWHQTKNGKLTPEDVMPSSGKKVWWLCKRGHEWEAVVASRNRGNNCPYCSSATSRLELRIYAELKYLFNDVLHRKKIYGLECDIYISDIKTGIEIDGAYWHKNKYAKDKHKTVALKQKGILLIRIREKGLNKISDYDIIKSNSDTAFILVKKIIGIIVNRFSLQQTELNKINDYLKSKNYKNDEEYLNFVSILPAPYLEKSLFSINKKLVQEWHYAKNKPLTPQDFTPFSTIKVWWLCEKGHEWEAVVFSRSRGNNCPYCSGQRAAKDNCLATINPSLAKEWHQTKNGKLTPEDVTPGSEKKVWWLCKRGHEWEANIANRNRGNNCPYCSGRDASKDNCLAVMNPELSKEWHPTKNGELAPYNVTPKSGKKVWWLCEKGHEWLSSIHNRAWGNDCPYCSGRRKLNE